MTRNNRVALDRQDRRELIIETAVAVFAERGKHGARMEEIAELAQINKALIYYYFVSKDLLFREVLVFILNRVSMKLIALFERTDYGGNDELALRNLLIAHYESFSENPDYAKVILNALAIEPQDMQWALIRLRQDTGRSVLEELLRLIESGVASKTFRPVDPVQVFISFMGMNLIYFLGKSIGESVLNIDIGDEARFLEQRRESILDLMMHGLLECDEKRKALPNPVAM